MSHRLAPTPLQRRCLQEIERTWRELDAATQDLVAAEGPAIDRLLAGQSVADDEARRIRDLRTAVYEKRQLLRELLAELDRPDPA